jgi:hypothetical protein
MTMIRVRKDAIQFFYCNLYRFAASVAHPRRLETAREYAEGEAWGRANGAKVEWVPDDHDNDLLGCVVDVPAYGHDSLWGIDVGEEGFSRVEDNYRRMVAAQLLYSILSRDGWEIRHERLT